MGQSLFGRSVEGALLAKDMVKMAKAGDQTARQAAEQHLARRMGKMRGLPQKMGQALSMSAIHQEGEPFKHLTDEADPLPFDMVTTILEEAWGKPWQDVLENLNPKGMAASLGQVHQGRLKDGREVAVKVAYPGIRDAVMNDLKILGWLGRGGERFMAGFDYESYRDVILKDLEDELDYQREADNQDAYARKSKDSAVIVPSVVREWLRQNVLVTSWEPGLTIEQASLWPESARKELGRLLARHFMQMFFDQGMIHADPHRGNYRFRMGPTGVQVVLYDYGSVARFKKNLRMRLLKLIFSTQNHKGDPLSQLAAIGFKSELLIPIAEKLPALCRVILEPFITQGTYDHHQWHRRSRLDDLLGEDRWNFRMSGSPDLVFLVRGFQGIFYYLDQLQVKLPWRHLLEGISRSYFAEMMVLNEEPIQAEPFGFEGMAQYLHIEVVEKGEKLVSIRFPSQSAERLATLMGEDILERIHRKGYDEQEIIRKVRAEGFAPGTLFTLDEPENQKRIRVWLA